MLDNDNNNVFIDALILQTRMANILANINLYSNIKAKDIKKYIIKQFNKIKTNNLFNDHSFWYAVFNLSEKEKELLGFEKFNEVDNKMMIPLWIWVCLPDDIIINGEMKKELDNEVDDMVFCVWHKV